MSYLHIGNDYSVNTKDIIGIFDLEDTSVSPMTREFLSLASKQGKVISCTDEMPKSFIVTLDKDFTETVYISQLAVATLEARSERQEAR